MAKQENLWLVLNLIRFVSSFHLAGFFVAAALVFYIAIKGGARGDSLCEFSVSEVVNRNFNKCDFIESTKGMVGPERGKIKLKSYKNN